MERVIQLHVVSGRTQRKHTFLLLIRRTTIYRFTALFLRPDHDTNSRTQPHVPTLCLCQNLSEAKERGDKEGRRGEEEAAHTRREGGRKQSPAPCESDIKIQTHVILSDNSREFIIIIALFRNRKTRVLFLSPTWAEQEARRQNREDTR